MSSYEIGFVEGGHDSPDDTATDKPQLNARGQYVHFVEDGVTEIVGGGIECELDGGTFDIAAYDITDGVVGAPRVFKQEVTLPERPLDSEDGYKVDTYTFDLDPVPLYGYVGRKLAVAVRHDRNRLWGTNSTDYFHPEHGYGYVEGDNGDPLAETWQHDLQDRGNVKTGGLFTEPIDVPDGNARTVIGDAVHGRLSETVFAAFSDLSPESGMVVEYDEQTAAGAPVTVLENGAIEVGKGSSETDSVDVRIRDTNGTWHGSKTLTLTEGSDQLTVAASGESIAVGGQTTLSVTAEAADRLTVSQLWADWGVQVSDAAGGTVQNSVSERGELIFEWDSIQSSATPSIAVSPPGETYVGGTYAVEVTAEGDSGSVTDTAVIDIQSSSAGQTAGTDETVTANTGTTLVANRGPDGSRLTSRPDGPAAHKTDGTVHLFTWDELGRDARVVLYDEDETTDWGGGPDVHIYDTMDRPRAEAGDVPSLDATRGQWQKFKDTVPELRPDGHSGEFSALVQDERDPQMFRTKFEATTEVFLSYCLKIPEGKKFPGAEQPGEFPDKSSWKLAWLYHDNQAADEDDVDIKLPSWASTFRLVGNNLDPDTSIEDKSEWWQFGEWMRFSFWLECGPQPESDEGEDGTIRFQVVTEGEQTQIVAEGKEPIMDEGQPPYEWERLQIPGWVNTWGSPENVEALYDDIYVATGDDSNARVELTDSTDYGASTRMQLCDIRSWSSNRVSATLSKGSLDSVDGAAIHLTTADEQQAVSMEAN